MALFSYIVGPYFWIDMLTALCVRLVFFLILGLELRALILSHSTDQIFYNKVFRDRVSKPARSVCTSWLRTVILLIAASWVPRITGVSHQCPALCETSYVALEPAVVSYSYLSNLSKLQLSLTTWLDLLSRTFCLTEMVTPVILGCSKN
jgi:hypothetical protein